jgi:hypothetical protein
MNNALKSALIAAATAFATAGAVAQEATPDTWTQIQTGANVQDVRAEAVASKKAGNIAHGEATMHGVKAAQPGPLTRAQVAAEAREALKLGLVSYGEGPARVATPSELEAVKLAGLRASGQAVALTR